MTTEVSAGVHAQQFIMRGVTACRLARGYTVAEDVTTVASTSVTATNALTAGTKYLVVYCSAAVKVAMGAAVSATNGVWVGAGIPTVFPVTVTGTADYDRVRVWCATAGLAVTLTQMID